jgi:3-keto-disaccharide hydrolase
MRSLFSRFVALAAFGLVMTVCHAQQGDNELTANEKKEGWILLFDGANIDDWRTYQNKEEDSWEIRDGQLYCKREGVSKRADLISRETFDDFELSIDWKVDHGANSGIIYRANEEHSASYESGPEYQLIDDEGYPEKLEDWQKSGSDYDMHPPAKIVSKPAGEYNHTVIKASGRHIEHWLNGEKVADFIIGSPEWIARKTKSKWKDLPNWGLASKGYICLQDHGGGIWFKNIKIRRL